jgi:hypothetical protein
MMYGEKEFTQINPHRLSLRKIGEFICVEMFIRIQDCGYA